jgi:hypothetical protein
VKNLYVTALVLLFVFSVSSNKTLPGVQGDSTLPVIDSIEFDKPDATYGETFLVSALVTDESGVESVTCYITRPNGQVYSEAMTYNPSSLRWETSFYVGQYWENGLHYVSSAYVRDITGLSGYRSNGTDFPTITIQIYGTPNPDPDPAVIDNVAFSTASATVGQTFWLYVYAHDDISDVDDVRIVLLRPDEITVGFIVMNYNANTVRWETSFTVGQYWAMGDFSVSTIAITDTAENYQGYTDGSGYTSPIITIYGTTPDPNPPELHELFISHDLYTPTGIPIYSQGELMNIFANITDDVSGVKSPIQIRIDKLPSEYIGFTSLSTYNSTTGLWEGSYRVGDFAFGEYVLQQVHLYDNVDNYVRLDHPTDYIGPTWIVYRANTDSDGDGMLDEWELLSGLKYDDPADATDDPDLDTLTNLEEYYNNTDPLNNDTDDDGLSDGEEVKIYRTDPLDPDYDDDGLTDGDEINIHGTDPNDYDSDDDCLNDGLEIDNGMNPNLADANTDTDGDGLSNFDEIFAGTNIGIPDTDGDGIDDYDEVVIYRTNGASSDSDGDGLTDPEEINDTANGLFGIGTDPNNNDTDYDGLSDYFEDNYIESYTNSTGHTVDGTISPFVRDTDGDYLSDYEELSITHTYPFEPDSDYDGIGDFEEYYHYESSPMLFDTDGDSLNDTYEIFVLQTNPNATDTDFDGIDDLFEFNTTLTDPMV